MSQIISLRDQIYHEALIQKQVAKFADAVNCRDEQQFASLWITEGIWEIKPPFNIKVQGKENIVQVFTQLLSNWQFFVQMVHSGVIEIKENQATARWCMNETGKSYEGKGFQNLGMYEDRLVLQDNTWLFVQRTYYFAYIEEPELSGTAFTLRK
jgi:SnoaL-like domain